MSKLIEYLKEDYLNKTNKKSNELFIEDQFVQVSDLKYKSIEKFYLGLFDLVHKSSKKDIIASPYMENLLKKTSWFFFHDIIESVSISREDVASIFQNLTDNLEDVEIKSNIFYHNNDNNDNALAIRYSIKNNEIKLVLDTIVYNDSQEDDFSFGISRKEFSSTTALEDLMANFEKTGEFWNNDREIFWEFISEIFTPNSSEIFWSELIEYHNKFDYMLNIDKYLDDELNLINKLKEENQLGLGIIDKDLEKFE